MRRGVDIVYQGRLQDEDGRWAGYPDFLWAKRAPRQHQALALGFRYRISEFPRSIDPQIHCLIDVAESSFLRVAVRHAPGKLRHFGDEGAIRIVHRFHRRDPGPDHRAARSRDSP